MGAAARPAGLRNLRAEGGGRLVAALSLSEVVSWGVLYYSFAVLLPAMAADTGWSTTALSGAFSVALLASALAAVPVGRWIDRRSARALMTTASAAGVLLLVAWSQSTSLVTLYATWAGLGLVMAAVLYEPAFAVISKRLPRTRRQAIALVTLAGALASTIFMPVTEALTSALGWREAVLALAVVVGAVTVPLHFLGIPRGRVADDTMPVDLSADAPSTRVAPSRALWLLAGATTLSALCTTALAVFLVSYLIERGLDPAAAAAAAGAMGAMQIPGRLILLFLGERIPGRLLAPAVFGLPGAGIVALLAVPSGAGVALMIVLAGMGNGMVTLLRATLVGDLFGAERYGAVAGLVSAPGTAAKAAAPVSAAAVAAALGGLAAMFAVLAALSGLAAIAAARLPRPAGA